MSACRWASYAPGRWYCKDCGGGVSGQFGTPEYCVMDADAKSGIVQRLRTNVCPDNHGCGVMPGCACADMQDAADELTRLRAEKAELVEALKVVRAFFGMIRFDRDRDTLAAEAFDATRAALKRAQSEPTPDTLRSTGSPDAWKG